MIWLRHIFHREEGSRKSRYDARERLKLVLVQDRVDLDAKQMEALKNDLIDVVDRYLDIDRTAMDVSFSRDRGSVAIVASLPLQNSEGRHASA